MGLASREWAACGFDFGWGKVGKKWSKRANVEKPSHALPARNTTTRERGVFACITG